MPKRLLNQTDVSGVSVQVRCECVSQRMGMNIFCNPTLPCPSLYHFFHVPVINPSPDGFREIKWGTDISELKGMAHVRTDPSYGGVEFYTRKGDELRFGDAQLYNIEYAF